MTPAGPGPGARAPRVRRGLGGRTRWAGAGAAALALLLALATLFPACSSPPRSLSIYAAASLTDVMEELAETYTNRTGVPVEVRPGASGALAALIARGAPADLYVSADPVWVDSLEAQGYLVEQSARVIAMNHLVAVIPAGVPLPARGYYEITDFAKIAVGDPETVPAGRYARESLTDLGVWKDAEPHLVYAQDVRAVLALVERREVDMGIVYASDAFENPRVTRAFELPDESHQPIVYVAAEVRASRRKDAAGRLLDFISSGQARDVFHRHGFTEE